MNVFQRVYCSVLSVHRIKVLAAAAVLTAVSFWGIRGLGVDADFMALLDASDETVKTYQAVRRNFPGTDVFAVFLDGRDKVSEETLESFRSQLQKLDAVSSVRVMPAGRTVASNEPDPSQALLMLVKPVFDPTDFSQTRRLSQTIRSLAETLNVQAALTGSYQILMESADAANRDMLRAGWITLIAILGLLVVVFRIPWVIVLCMALTLTIGLSWTLGLVRLTLGQLNLLTATLPAVILGLGVDFSLHVIYAFHEKASERPPAGSVGKLETRVQFLDAVFSKIYKPLLIGAGTTSAAFLSLWIAGSAGLRQMGLMGALGIGCTFVAATGVLPILLASVPAASLAGIHRLSGRWLSGAPVFASQGRLITAIVLILIAGAWGSARVRFSSDQNKLADQTLPAYALQQTLQDQQGVSLVPIAIVSPDPQTEAAKLAFLKTLPDSPFGFVESGLLAPEQNDDPARFSGAGGTRLILAYPQKNAFEPAVFRRIDAAAEQLHLQFPAAGNAVTGSPFLNAALNRTLKADLLHCSLAAALLVCVFVFYGFRTVLRTGIAMMPVVLGTFLMIGLMGTLAIDFTVMTIVIVPLIIGAGIDDGVHLLSRWQAENRTMPPTLHAVATPIIATSVTSMIAFGSLMISDHPGFRQLGLVVTAGLGFCVLITLWILPPLLNLVKGNKL